MNRNSTLYAETNTTGVEREDEINIHPIYDGGSSEHNDTKLNNNKPIYHSEQQQQQQQQQQQTKERMENIVLVHDTKNNDHHHLPCNISMKEEDNNNAIAMVVPVGIFGRIVADPFLNDEYLEYQHHQQPQHEEKIIIMDDDVVAATGEVSLLLFDKKDDETIITNPITTKEFVFKTETTTTTTTTTTNHSVKMNVDINSSSQVQQQNLSPPPPQSSDGGGVVEYDNDDTTMMKKKRNTTKDSSSSSSSNNTTPKKCTRSFKQQQQQQPQSFVTINQHQHPISSSSYELDGMNDNEEDEEDDEIIFIQNIPQQQQQHHHHQQVQVLFNESKDTTVTTPTATAVMDSSFLTTNTYHTSMNTTNKTSDGCCFSSMNTITPPTIPTTTPTTIDDNNSATTTTMDDHSPTIKACVGVGVVESTTSSSSSSDDSHHDNEVPTTVDLIESDIITTITTPPTTTITEQNMDEDTDTSEKRRKNDVKTKEKKKEKGNILDGQQQKQQQQLYVVPDNHTDIKEPLLALFDCDLLDNQDQQSFYPSNFLYHYHQQQQQQQQQLMDHTSYYNGTTTTVMIIEDDDDDIDDENENKHHDLNCSLHTKQNRLNPLFTNQMIVENHPELFFIIEKEIMGVVVANATTKDNEENNNNYHQQNTITSFDLNCYHNNDRLTESTCNTTTTTHHPLDTNVNPYPLDTNSNLYPLDTNVKPHPFNTNLKPHPVDTNVNQIRDNAVTATETSTRIETSQNGTVLSCSNTPSLVASSTSIMKMTKGAKKQNAETMIPLEQQQQYNNNNDDSMYYDTTSSSFLNPPDYDYQYSISSSEMIGGNSSDFGEEKDNDTDSDQFGWYDQTTYSEGLQNNNHTMKGKIRITNPIVDEITIRDDEPNDDKEEEEGSPTNLYPIIYKYQWDILYDCIELLQNELYYTNQDVYNSLCQIISAATSSRGERNPVVTPEKEQQQPKETSIPKELQQSTTTTVLHLATTNIPYTITLCILSLIANRFSSSQEDRNDFFLVADTDGNLPIHLACGNMQVVHESTYEQSKEYDDPNHNETKNNNNDDALTTSPLLLQITIIQTMASLAPESLLVSNHNGDTPLHMLLACPAFQRNSSMNFNTSTEMLITLELNCEEILTSLIKMVVKSLKKRKKKHGGHTTSKSLGLWQNKYGATLLHVAIGNGCYERVLMKLLQFLPESTLVEDSYGLLPMHYVAGCFHSTSSSSTTGKVSGTQCGGSSSLPYTFVNELMYICSDSIYCQCKWNGNTPLHLLLINSRSCIKNSGVKLLDRNYTKLCELLIGGVCVDHDYLDSNTATLSSTLGTETGVTIVPSTNNYDRVLSPMLIQNYDDLSPLHCCALYETPYQLTRIVMDSSLSQQSLEIQTHTNGVTPLHLLVGSSRIHESIDNLRLFTNKKTSACMIRDTNGCIPLMVALQNKKCTSTVVSILIEASPTTVYLKNTSLKAKGNDMIPLHYATKNSKIQKAVIKELLRAYPLGIQMVTKDGDTPLHLAAKYSASKSVIELLIDVYPQALEIRNHNDQLPYDVANSSNSNLRLEQIWKLFSRHTIPVEIIELKEQKREYMKQPHRQQKSNKFDEQMLLTLHDDLLLTLPVDPTTEQNQNGKSKGNMITKWIHGNPLKNVLNKSRRQGNRSTKMEIGLDI